MPLEEPSAPPTIADYELIRLVGRGSYGDVWLARGVTGIYRAIKIVWRARFEDPQPYEREFRGLKEFAAISLLESRQLALLHVGRNDALGFFYYAMELADDIATGRDVDPEKYVPHTLREIRLRRGKLAAVEVVTLGADLARALNGLHSRGLVHRDIKPSNVILVGGVPKLADIGLVASASAALTFVDTEGYVPPEGPGAPAADVYALGKLLYELATGLDRHDYPRLPPDLTTRTDRKALLELNEVFIRACEPLASKRHGDAGALLEDLLLLQAGKSVRRLRAAERHLSRALRLAAMLAVAATVAGAGAWVATKRAQQESALRAEAEAERDILARRRLYSGNLASAQTALQQGDLLRARALLKELEPKRGQVDLRQFEWRALWHQAQGDPHEEIRKIGMEITKLALSPDESLIAVHDRSQTVALYETAGGKETMRISGIWKLAGFSADGRWLVGSDEDQTSQRWAVNNGHVDVASKTKIGLPIVAVGSDHILALTRDAPRRLREWNFTTRMENSSLDLGMEDGGPAWSEFIASSSDDGRTLVRVWLRSQNNQTLYRLTCIRWGAKPTVQHRDLGSLRPAAVGVTPLGPWALVDPVGDEPESTVWRCGADGWAETAERFPRGVNKVLESSGPNQQLQLLVRRKEIGWLQDRTPGSTRQVRWARGHDAIINEVVVSSRNRQVYSAGADGSLFRWNWSGPCPTKFAAWNSRASATGMVFTADGKRIWVAEDGANSILLDVATLAPTARSKGMRYPIALRDGRIIGIGDKTGLISIDAESGVFHTQTMASHRIRIAAVSEDGSELAAIDDRHNLLAGTPTEPRIVGQDFQWYFTLIFDATGRRLWTTNPNTRELVGLRWPTGEAFFRKDLPARTPVFRMLPDQQRLIVALENGNLEIRDPASGELLKEKYSGSPAPQSLASNPEGTRMFVGGINGDIHCFDPATWEEVHVFSLGDGLEFHRLTSTTDGKTLAALTKTGTLYLLRTE